ncbi:hypothetical protein [Pseudomonas syringae group genomosp. 3]|uniref:hypothetical protein n=1 Tax=Pseudomonas syringae group TaxID=136849 RepID=UPI0006E4EA07|nr:hypothetical protein [Pseudomonas syringae group genomosp. 3]KPW43355.1 Alcohol dehydrogenase, zinc-containing [Pseudomonas syringae pv. berberidis]KPY26219.1 Alcohol dehydrogenase, zinc-containing [Pseudomonas syringae pv. philadelphi]RMM23544.1 Alcohol dehydrogenase, zinc-containing [Pseudomonas syringae pv. berberidis]RMP64554.1 Alcohol dehydrogenase, zinc-containing [Pseudomonas syringae pv. berberidis]RMQ40954.1 Alcohol dehydrogenase, zinc-containing [Pseudomonas syringae pv. berberidi
MIFLITGAEQFDTRIRVAQKKKATEWLKLFIGSISPNHDSWMLTLKVGSEVFYAGSIVRLGGYSEFKVVDEQAF